MNQKVNCPCLDGANTELKVWMSAHEYDRRGALTCQLSQKIDAGPIQQLGVENNARGRILPGEAQVFAGALEALDCDAAGRQLREKSLADLRSTFDQVHHLARTRYIARRYRRRSGRAILGGWGIHRRSAQG
jgi:hypothetical protein